METIAVTVTPGFPIPEQYLDEIRAVDPRLRVRVISPEQRPFLRLDRADADDPAARSLRELLAETEIVISAFELPPALAQRAPKLRWVQTLSAGVERLLDSGFLEHGVTLTNGSGATAIPIAEHVIMVMLMLAKQAPAVIRDQDQHRWVRHTGFELQGKMVGIVGLGAIGTETAKRAKAFGCPVIGMRRSSTEPQENVQGVDLLLPPRDLPRLLAESVFVVIAAPATDATKALIDAAALAQMKQGSYLINIARGSLVDEAALIEALKRGHLAGAALDVFQQEPLPPESELWGMPQVIVTPHNSTMSEHFLRRQTDLITENLRRFLREDQLLNLVTPERGY